MLTYQLQRRTCRIKNNIEFTFPNDVVIEVYLEPSEQFGVGDRPSKTAVRAHKARVYFDANTGRRSILSDPLLESIEAIIEWDNLRLEMQGNKLVATTRCDSFQNLEDLLTTLHYIMPIILNVELAEPPVVKRTAGQVGESIFNWELSEIKLSFETTTKEKQDIRVIDSFQFLGEGIISGLSNRRLAAAMYYCYVARRLVEAGHSPYEFMADVILNFCKILQIMFGEDRDDVRAELSRLDYPKNDIEVKFIPIMILRNEFDVGHVSISLFTREQLDALYMYLEETERDFQELLKKVISKIKDGSYTLRQDPDLSLDKDKLKIMNRLIETFEKRADIIST